MKITKEEILLYNARMDMMTIPNAVGFTIHIMETYMEGNPALVLAAFQNDEYTEHYLLEKMIEMKEKYQPCLTLIKNTLEAIYYSSRVSDCSCVDLVELYNLYEKFNNTGKMDYIETLLEKIDEAFTESEDDDCDALLQVLCTACKVLIDADQDKQSEG